MSDMKHTKPRPEERPSVEPHEVCGWTGASATQVYAEVASTAKSGSDGTRTSALPNGDLSVASPGSMSELSEIPQETIWKPVIIFFAVVLALSAALTVRLHNVLPVWLRAILIPMFPVLCATFVFWWRQRWKFRAKDWQFRLKVCQEALDSVGYEVANSLNAIRGNLIGFRLANPDLSMAEHLDLVDEGARRIDRVVQKSMDPVGWWVTKKKKKAPDSEPSQLGGDTRSRIAL